MSETEQEALSASITRLVILNAVNRGRVVRDTDGVPRINLGADGWAPIPLTMDALRRAGLVHRIYYSDEEPFRHWMPTAEGHRVLQLDDLNCSRGYLRPLDT